MEIYTYIFEIVKSPYWFDILFNQTLIKSLGETKMLSFNKVFNSLSLCFVYLVLFCKPFQTFIIYFTCIVSLYRNDTVRLIVDWFFKRCICMLKYISVTLVSESYVLLYYEKKFICYLSIKYVEIKRRNYTKTIPRSGLTLTVNKHFN